MTINCFDWYELHENITIFTMFNFYTCMNTVLNLEIFNFINKLWNMILIHDK